MAPIRKRPRSRAGIPRNRGSLEQQTEQPELCRVEKCGRRSYARRLCQTHHRQMRTSGKVKPIRPYRRRQPGTVKFAGLRLSPSCAAKVDAHATKLGIARGAAIAAILEDWLAEMVKERAQS